MSDLIYSVMRPQQEPGVDETGSKILKRRTKAAKIVEQSETFIFTLNESRRSYERPRLFSNKGLMRVRFR